MCVCYYLIRGNDGYEIYDMMQSTQKQMRFNELTQQMCVMPTVINRAQDLKGGKWKFFFPLPYTKWIYMHSSRRCGSCAWCWCLHSMLLIRVGVGDESPCWSYLCLYVCVLYISGNGYLYINSHSARSRAFCGNCVREGICMRKTPTPT